MYLTRTVVVTVFTAVIFGIFGTLNDPDPRESYGGVDPGANDCINVVYNVLYTPVEL